MAHADAALLQDMIVGGAVTAAATAAIANGLAKVRSWQRWPRAEMSADVQPLAWCWACRVGPTNAWTNQWTCCLYI